MITCPECGEGIADNSAHCGHCGAQIEEGSGKKTMFGLGAISQDELDQAAETAKQKSAEADEAGGDAGKKKPSGGLKLPKPGMPRPSKTSGQQGQGKEGDQKGGLSLPKPGMKKSKGSGGDDSTAGGPGSRLRGPSSSAESASSTPSQGAPDRPQTTGSDDTVIGNDDVDSEARTQAMDSVHGDFPSLGSGDEPVAPPAGGGEAEETGPMDAPSIDAPSVGAPPTEPEETGPVTPGGSAGPSQLGAPKQGTSQPDLAVPGAESSSPGTGTDFMEPEASGPSEMGGPGPEAMPQGAPGGPVQAADRDMPGSAMTEFDKDDDQQKKLIYIAVGIGAIVMMCCVGSGLWFVWENFF